MKKLLTILLLFISAHVFGQTYTPPVSPVQVPTMTWYRNAQGMWGYRGSSLGWWLFADSLMVKRMISAAVPSTLTFNNGLIQSGSVVKWGGTLLGTTTMDALNNDLDIASTRIIGPNTFAGFLRYRSGGVLQIGSENNAGGSLLRSQFQFSTAQTTFTDDLFHSGILYNHVDLNNFTDQSLINKRYADSLHNSLTFGNGLTNTAGVVGLGGTLANSTFIDGNNQLFFIGTSTGFLALGPHAVSSGSTFNGVQTNFTAGSSTGEISPRIFMQRINSTGGISSINIDSAGIHLRDDSLGHGILYTKINFNNLIDSSLVPKAYVDNRIDSIVTTLPTITASNGINRNVDNFELGNPLTKTTTIDAGSNLFLLGDVTTGSGLFEYIPGNGIFMASADTAYFGSINAKKGIVNIYNQRISTGKTNNIILENGDMTVIDGIKHTGLKHDASVLRSLFTDNSYIDKKYHDSTLTASGFASKDSSLQVNKNLYDLADKAVSRTNLSVYSKAQSDANYIANGSSLQAGAVFNIDKAIITGTTPASVSTTTGSNGAIPLSISPANGGNTSKSTGTGIGGNAANLSITMGKGGGVTGSPVTGIGGNGGNVYLLAGDAGDVTGTSKIPGISGEFIAQGGLSSNVDGASGGNTSIKGGNGETSHNTSGGNVYLVAGQGHGTGLDGSILLNVSAGSTVRGNTVIAGTIDDRLHRLQVTGSIISTDTVVTPRIKLTGTAGNGLIDYLAQSSTPATPAINHQISYADASGRFTLMGSNGFAASFSKSLLTASRVYSFPDSTGTFALENRIIPNNNLANSTISGISLGSNLANHIAGTGLTGSNYNGSGAQTWTANLATGVAGGQSVIGGTASGNSLTLSSTTHATKGKILFGNSAYDEANNYLGIGVSSPGSILTVEADALGGTAGAATTALTLQNTTAAANNAQQVSPALILSSNGWNTGGSSQNTNWRVLNLPIQGSTITSTLQFQQSSNGGAYTTPLTVSTGGVLTTSSTIIANPPGSTTAGFTSNGTTANANFTTITTGIGSSTTAKYLFGAVGTTNYRTAIGAGATSTALTAGANYVGTLIPSAPITAATSSTNPWAVNLGVLPIGTYTSGTGTVTNSASLYIDGAAAFATNNYALYVNSGNTVLNNGNLSLGTAGNKINIATGTNASVGRATLVGGTVTVNTTAVTANSEIFLTDRTTGALTNVGTLTVGTVVAGTSFVINSTNILDTSNVSWFIIN